MNLTASGFQTWLWLNFAIAYALLVWNLIHVLVGLGSLVNKKSKTIDSEKNKPCVRNKTTKIERMDSC